MPADREALCAPEETLDTLFHGKIRVIQKKSGYRFSIDAVILAHFPNFKEKDIVADIGCGCGVIPLIIAYRRPQVRLFGLELQEDLFDLARRNVIANGLEDRITIQQGDLKNPEGIFFAPANLPMARPSAYADWVVSNPPYGRSSSGRLNPKEEKALARHEIAASLLDVLKAARYFLKPRGRAAFIYPARRTAGLISAMRETGLEPKRLQVVYSYPGDEGSFVLVEAVKDGGEELKILPPFFIYDQARRYSPEMQRLYKDRAAKG
ncbi:MAG: tRNA1(Val) (adenine(37)-N6)-methyltransferase [Deltaproteobacteria bacterium]|nr:MAG: tRNA1(Val) (adenine(37)-N6)-methyltransferase [Deltaproteobacteria bacterium]